MGPIVGPFPQLGSAASSIPPSLSLFYSLSPSLLFGLSKHLSNCNIYAEKDTNHKHMAC